LFEKITNFLGDDAVDARLRLVDLREHRRDRFAWEPEIRDRAPYAVGPIAQPFDAGFQNALHENWNEALESAAVDLGLVGVRPASRLTRHGERVPPAPALVKCRCARRPGVQHLPTMSVDFQRRRERVREAMGDAALVVFAAPYSYRNNDVENEWRQESDFHYLSGFDEPDSVLVLRGGTEPRFVLFVRPRDPEREAWDGPRAGVEGATATYGADAAFPLDELAKELPGLLGGVESVHYALGRARANDDVLLQALEGVRRLARRGTTSTPRSIVDPATVLHEQRLVKSPEEIARMERAIAITAEGHRAVMAKSKPGMFEYEAEALLRGAFRQQGSERHAYPPIVGSGPNGTILHYRKNDRQMREGDLLLVDAGSEYDYYASDVTRTFPVSGGFTPAQRKVYALVLEAELKAIDAVRPGATLESVHAAAARVLTEGLIELGLLEGPLDDALENKRYKPWFMHGTSHWLGMDVHDVGAYYIAKKARPLTPGMVLTVEPGLYFTETDERVQPEFRGIGIRIEDDVLVTETGARVLSEAIPKHIDAVEQACRG